MAGKLLLLALTACCFAIICIPSGSGSPYGTCKNFTSYTPVHFFDVPKFAGQWYLQELYYHPEEEYSVADTKCYKRAIRAPSTQPKLVYLDYNYIISDPENGDVNVAGVANYSRTTGIFPLESAWSMVVGEDQVPAEPYTPIIWVQTDYDNWAIAYECQNIQSAQLSFESMLLFTREPVYDDEKTLGILRTAIANYGYSAEFMSPVDNANCS